MLIMSVQAADGYTQEDGVLPSNIVPNPREDLKVITTWSGVTLAGPSVLPPLSYSKEVERDPKLTTDQVLTESTTRVPSPVVQPSPTSKLPPAPASSSSVIPKQNPPHMPKYAKMVKDLLTYKEKLLELSNAPLNENCSTVLLKKIESCMALADLGASINLMPLFVWKKLSLPKLTPTRMTRGSYPDCCLSSRYSRGCLLREEKFTFPADFVVIDYDVDPRVPLILGRPILRMAHALVDVHGEELTLRVGDEKLVFNVESTSKYPRKHGDESIHKIDILDITCEDHFHEVLNVQKSINPLSDSPTPSSDPVVASLSPSLTPFRDSDFILEEIDTFLASDDSISPDIDDGIFDPERYPLSGGVWTGRRLMIFLKPATMVPPGDIMAQTTPPRKFLTLVSTGPPYIAMPRTWSHIVTHVNVKEKSDKRMKCLRILSKMLISLKCGASAFWARFHLELHGPLSVTEDQSYENSLIYKQKMKKIHDANVKNREFHVGDRVLLFNSRLNIFSGKLKSHWFGPFTVSEVFPYGTVELSQLNGPNFTVNRHRIKHYYGGDIPVMDVSDLYFSPKDK
ncbi:reverse transcriptase domain-containing protein [Tanacetum coccineum]